MSDIGGNGNNKAVIEKVRKLFALANNNANENEAFAAAEKAQQLLAEHDLSMSDLEGHNALKELMCDTLLTDRAVWVKPLISEIARFCFCAYYYQAFPSWWVEQNNLHHNNRSLRGAGHNRQYIRHSFVGEKQNIIVAQHMVEYLVSTIERLCAAGEKTVPANERSRYRTSFLNSCSTRLCARLHECRQQQEKGGGNLPVLYDNSQKDAQEWMEQNEVKIKQKRQVALISHQGGSRDGRSAADKVGLDTQIRTNRHTQIS